MKKSLFLLTVLLLSWAVPALADEATVTFTGMYANGTSVNGTAIAIPDSPLTVTFGKGSGSSNPAYYTTGGMRVYYKNTVTISGAQIEKVVFTFSASNYTFDAVGAAPTVSNGSYSYSGTTGTWIVDPAADNIVMTLGGTKGHGRVVSITVTYASGGSVEPDPVEPDVDKIPVFSQISEMPAEATPILLTFAELNKVVASLDASKTYGYLPVSDVVVDDATIAYPMASAFTLEPSGTAYKIKDSLGRYLYQTGTYNSFNVSATAADTDNYMWTVLPQPDGSMKIVNLATDKYMQLDPAFGTVGSYAEEKGSMPSIFAFSGKYTIAAPEIDPAEFDGNEAFEATITGPEGYDLYYTLDGTVPTAESDLYEGPVTIETSCTLMAVAIKDDVVSAVAAAVYTLVQPDVVLSPSDATSEEAVTVAMTQAGSDKAAIYYTTDGSDPTAESTLYTGPVTVEQSTVIRAVAICGKLQSNITEGVYQIGKFSDGEMGEATGNIIFEEFGYANAEDLTETSKDGIVITYDAGGNNNTPKYYNTGKGVRMYPKNSMTVTAPAGATIVKIEFLFSAAGSTTYNFAAVGSNSPVVSTGSYSESGVNGVWTGEAPAVTFTLDPSATSGSIRLVSLNVTYAMGAPDVDSPVFTPEPGVYGMTQTVSIEAAEGADIYYTVNGGYPVADEQYLYTGPLTVERNSTIRAIASLDGKLSLLSTGVYTFEFMPVITPAGGLFYDPVTVSVVTGRPDAKIYYTTDGSEPTAESTLYTEPIVISENCTLSVIAYDEIDNDGETETIVSRVVSATYTFGEIDYEFYSLQDMMNELLNEPVWNRDIDPWFPIGMNPDEGKVFRFMGRLEIMHLDSVNVYLSDGFNQFDFNAIRFKPRAKGEQPYALESGRYLMPGGVYRLGMNPTASPGTTDNYLGYYLEPQQAPVMEELMSIIGPQTYSVDELTEGVDSFMVNRTVVLENIKFTAETPAQDGWCTARLRTFTGTSPEGVKLTFSNNLAVESVAAGSYNVTAVVAYKAVIKEQKSKVDEFGEVTITQQADTTVSMLLYPIDYQKYVAPVNPETGSEFKKITGMPETGSYLLGASGKFSTPLAESKNYGYLDVTELTADGESVRTERENALELIAVEGGYRIRDSYGRYYYQTGTYNSFNVSTELPANADEALWTIEAQGDDTYRITNVAVSKYIQFSERYNSYGSYADEQGLMPTLWKLSENSAIEDADADHNAPVELYNLQGVRVNPATATPGLYIIRQGGKSQKIVIR